MICGFYGTVSVKVSSSAMWCPDYTVSHFTRR